MRILTRHRNYILKIIFLGWLILMVDVSLAPFIRGYLTLYIDFNRFLVIPFGLKLLPTAFGIFLGLIADRFVDTDRRLNRVEEVAPMVIVELYKNLDKNHYILGVISLLPIIHYLLLLIKAYITLDIFYLNLLALNFYQSKHDKFHQ